MSPLDAPSCRSRPAAVTLGFAVILSESFAQSRLNADGDLILFPCRRMPPRLRTEGKLAAVRTQPYPPGTIWVNGRQTWAGASRRSPVERGTSDLQKPKTRMPASRARARRL